MKRLALGLVLVFTFMLLGRPGQRASAAPPDPDVYHIAVLEVGCQPDCWTDSDFSAVSNAFTWTSIPTTDLTASGLAPFNVLIIPYNHDKDWYTPSGLAAITAFVQGGGTLMVHTLDKTVSAGPDALFDGFGPTYALSWLASENGDEVLITDPANPLVASPNTLSSADLSNWGQSFHNLIGTSGSAWHWAATGVSLAETPETGDVLGCAAAGQGAIVVTGLDPESHSDSHPGALLLIENEITVNRAGICAGVPPTGTLTLTKLCPNGTGSAVFNVTVTGPTTAPVTPIACGATATTPDLTPGDYTISELITGADSANFSTAFVCTNADGSLTSTIGASATATITGGVDTACLIVNALNTGAVSSGGTGGTGGTGTGAAGVVIPNIFNLLNNLNANTNTSVNTNTNTLTQNNTQTQSNDNSQTTNVNANPTQNVNVGGADVTVQ